MDRTKCGNRGCEAAESDAKQLRGLGCTVSPPQGVLFAIFAFLKAWKQHFQHLLNQELVSDLLSQEFCLRTVSELLSQELLVSELFVSELLSPKF